MHNNFPFQAVLFDLDGTIIDPKEGIINSIFYAAKEFGLEEKHPETLNSFIGPPLHQSFQNRYQLSEMDAMEVVRLYRLYYSEKGIFECHLYDGIEELIKTLFDLNVFMSLATSKPVGFADRLMKYYDLDSYIEFTAGALMDGKRTDKKDVIQFALDHIPTFDKRSVLMLGDREFDIDGGKHHGLQTAYARWGYGVDEIVLNSDPDFVLDSPLELLKIF